MPAADPIAAHARRLLLGTLFFTALVKLAAACFLPLTGDEAYFLLWGRHPDFGYYDHGPMTGWWMAALLQCGDALGWIRLPAVALPYAVAWWLRAALRPEGEARADLAAALFLLSPVNLASILHTTDTSLFALATLAGIIALAADRRQSLALWCAAGFCLGLAFLAKYFAVLIGVSWAVWQLSERPRPRWRPVAAVLLGAAPAVAVNIHWNHLHGWTNVLFNVITRNSEAGLNPFTPLYYVLGWAIVIGPAFALLLVRYLRDRGWRGGWRDLTQRAGRGAWFMVAVPAVVFGLVSLVQDIGLHWLLAFAPWAMLVVIAGASAEQLARVVRPAVIFAGALGVVLIAAIVAPTDWVKGSPRKHASVVISRHADEIAAALAPYRKDYLLTSDSYTRAGLLAYHLGAEVPVLGPGSFHGRQDDLLTDFRTFDGKNLMLLAARNADEPMRRWFDALETREIEVRGARFHLILGRGFRYAAYREDVLQKVADNYYAMPAWLARWSPPGDLVRRYDLTPALR